MNKKFLLAWLAVFVAWFLGSFLVHGIALHADYMSVRQLYRGDQEEQKLLPLMILAHVFLSGAFVWIYARGVEARPWLGQGMRFGVAVALLAVIPNYLIYYVVQPLPETLVVKQIAFDTILVLVLGAIAAFMYRTRP